MADGAARVRSVQALADFRAAMAVFAHEVASALSESDAEVQRTIQWLRLEQLPYWQKQILLRQDELKEAKNALYRRELATLPDRPMALEERRAVERAGQRLEEARERLERTRRWIAAWDREAPLYRGACQPLADFVARDHAMASAELGRLHAALEAYVAMTGPLSGGGAGEREATATMARGAGEAGDEAGEKMGPGRTGGGPGVRFATVLPQGARDATAWLSMAAVPPVSKAVRLRATDAAVLERLGFADMPGDQEVVLVEEGALNERLVTLVRQTAQERLGEDGAGGGEAKRPDSGWGINCSVASGGRAVGAMRVGEVLALRRDLRSVLALPEGSVVVLAEGAILSVMGPDGREMWHAEAEGPEGSEGGGEGGEAGGGTMEGGERKEPA